MGMEMNADRAALEAKNALIHYLRLAGVPTAGDHAAEIRGIVDNIIDAAATKAVEQIKKEL